MAKGDQIPMFEPELRLCLGCRTKYQPIPELHKGGYCPTCGSTRHEPAVPSDYSMSDPEPEPEKEQPETPQLGSTEDYLNE